MASEPLIRGEWLQAGQHLDLVGAYTPTMREADDEVLRRGELFVDSRKTAGETGELMIPAATGVIDDSAVRADLFQLCRDEHPGRTDETQITVFKNGGGGHLDLMSARVLQRRLEADG
jgi:alanine dehydrogenase